MGGGEARIGTCRIRGCGIQCIAFFYSQFSGIGISQARLRKPFAVVCGRHLQYFRGRKPTNQLRQLLPLFLCQPGIEYRVSPPHY